MPTKSSSSFLNTCSIGAEWIRLWLGTYSLNKYSFASVDAKLEPKTWDGEKAVNNERSTAFAVCGLRFYYLSWVLHEILFRYFLHSLVLTTDKRWAERSIQERRIIGVSLRRKSAEKWSKLNLYQFCTYNFLTIFLNKSQQKWQIRQIVKNVFLCKPSIDKSIFGFLT